MLINMCSIIMLSTKNNNNNSSIYANSGTFDNLLINGVLTNALLTSSLNRISWNTKTILGNINTISWSLNNLTNYLKTTTFGDVKLTWTKFNYNNLTVFKPQTEYTNNIAIQQFINQLF